MGKEREAFFMKENIVQQALVNSFKSRGVILRGTVQFKQVEREVRRLIVDDDPIKITDLERMLQDGVVISYNGLRFVSEWGNDKELQNGAVKKLAREIDKRTNSPKTTRGTVYRRNSTVIERRVQNPNWRTSPTALLEKKRKSDITLSPEDEWKQKQERKATMLRDEKIQITTEKKSRRQIKKMIQEEWRRRMNEDEAVLFMNLIQSICESKGIANPEEMQKRIQECKALSTPVPVIFVWGPPYERQGQRFTFSDVQPEAETAKWIEEVLQRIKDTGLTIRPILLYADIYGTEINGISKPEVDSYGQSLIQRFSCCSEIIPWSVIRTQNKERYDYLKSMIGVIPNDRDIEQAKNVQQKLGRNISNQEATEYATRYKIERLVEGQILSDGFTLNGTFITNVIKLGTASSKVRNDDPYEQSLPRFYVKNLPRAPWSKKRSYEK